MHWIWVFTIHIKKTKEKVSIFLKEQLCSAYGLFNLTSHRRNGFLARFCGVFTVIYILRGIVLLFVLYAVYKVYISSKREK